MDRPYRTVDQAVPQALLADVTDPEIARLPASIGAIDQWVSSVDLLGNSAHRTALRTAYELWANPG
jgi:hypothetical protein